MKLHGYIVSIALCLLCFGSVQAQYADVHYIAPSPWVYWTGAYELVLSTEVAAVANVSVSRSDGTLMLNTTVSQGNPTAFRFTGNPAGVANHPINTILNDAGIIVTGTQPIAVNVRNVTSDQVGVGNCIDTKGNSSLTSFGNEGLGINFRLGYYRSDYNGVGYCYALPVVNCAMAIDNGTELTLNGAPLTTLNAGQSYIFIAPMGSFLESTGPIVVNSGAYVDSPQGCGDGVVDQVAPTSVLDTAYFVVRGLGTVGTATDLPEQTTIVATRPATDVVVNHYNAAGVLIGTNNYTLGAAGNFVSFHHGDAATQYSSSHIVATKPIAVYAGSAVSCEVDMSFVPPVGPCAGSFRVETTNFRSYLNTTLPYNGFVLLEDPVVPVFMNGVDLESVTSPRFQIGNTGYYMIRFSDAQIGFPANMLINSAERMNIAIVQQGGGFTMSAYFSSFNQVLDPPTLAPSGTCRTALFTAEPGYAPYQWFLDEVAIPGATGQTYLATTSGFYSVAGTRPCGLTKPSIPVYFDDSATTPDLSVVLPDTLKCNNPTVTLTAASTTPGATYDWGGGNTNATYSVSAPGSYVVTVTEPINNCDTTETLVVEIDTTSPNVSIAPPLVINCNRPTVNLVASTTTPSATFDWGGGNNTDTETVGTAGNYTVTATDNANGCTATATETVTSIPLLGLTETHVDVACFGGNTGSIDVTIVGGQAPLTYAWSHGPATEDVSNLIAGVYTLTVTDNQACDTTISITLTEPLAALALDTNLTHVLCFGEATGAVDLVPSGGTLPYGFAWSNSANTEDLNNITAGSYTVTVTDGNGCVDSLSATLTEPASALSATSVATDVNCFGDSDGTIDLSPVGGTTPYTFLWSNAEVTEDLTNVVAGIYTVTIADANGCTLTHRDTINEPTELTVSLSPTNIACFGESTGEITSTVNGGLAPYTYLWDNAAITAGITSLAAGSYGLTVTDANGCTDSARVTLTEPLAALALDTNLTHVLCFGEATGAVDLVPSGGTLPYGFAWSNSANTEDLNNITAGSYTVTVTDGNGCVDSLSATILEPASALSATSIATDVNCFGDSDGAIDLSPVGGTLPYTFLWSNAEVTEDLTNVVAGIYTVTITDANGCTLTRSDTINEPTELTVSLTPTNIACFGESTGEITSTVNGGLAPYTYLWDNSEITADISNLAAGSYGLTVTDANGCMDSARVALTEPAAALALDTNLTHVLCFGNATGAVDLIPSGGTLPYGFAWSNSANTEDLNNITAGSYTVTVTDGNGCVDSLSATLTEPASALSATSVATDVNCFGDSDGAIDLSPVGGTAPYTFLWSNAEVTEDLTNVVAGIYTVTIADANGCTLTHRDTINEPTELTVSLSPTNIACFGESTGEITSTVNGGLAPYTYLWDNAAITADISNLAAGSYGLTVTDANGCTDSARVTLTEPLAALALDTNLTHVLCFGDATGAVDLVPSGGTLPYGFAWSNSANTEDLSNITAGGYTVTVTDGNGCVDSLSATILEPASALSATSIATDVNCFGDNDGAIDLSPVGGTLPYTFLWSNVEVTEDLTNVVAGIYTVTIADANGCTLTRSDTINEPTELTVSLSPTNIACFGESTGEITSTGNGGLAPYTYLWDNSEITADISNLAAGSYGLTVTDANGCVDSARVALTEPAAALALDTNLTHVLCFGNATGAVDLIPSGGTLPYGFAWSNSANTEDLNNITAGGYTVTVTDGNGCVDSLSATLTEPASALSATSVATDVNCFGDSDGAIDLSPVGGTTPYTFLWSNAEVTEDLINVVAGIYTVTITDANGCTLTHRDTISQPDNIHIALTVSGISCNTDNEADITSATSGGIAPYTYLWNDASTNADLIGVAAGNYSVTVTDVQNCTATANVQVVLPPAIAFTYAVTDVSCYSYNDGYLDLSTSGGTGAITVSWAGGEYPDNSFSGLAPGSYTLNLTDENGCDTSFAITVVQPDSISIDILPIDTLRIGEKDTLQTVVVNNPGTTNYYWEPSEGLSCNDCPAPEVEVYWDTQYFVTLDNNGCSATDTIWVRVNSDHILYIPNAFSPNGDGQNDRLYVYAKGVKKIVWSVFDRWGEVVFTADDINSGWDGSMNGKILPPGVFVINVYIEFLDLTSERHTQSVMLMR